MAYDGYIDRTDGWSVFGWAVDLERRNQPLEVQYSTGSGRGGVVRADQFRADLQAQGHGDGRHAFAIPWPEEDAAAGGSMRVWIRGTSFELKGGPAAWRPRESVGLVAGDIVNNCNLRCPFCMVDYGNIHGLKLMAEETYARALELLPGIPRGNFWLSCLHEPTLHPRFIDFVERVPTAYRDRLSFTSNLAKRLGDDVLERLANSGIDHLRVSYDSRVPEVFQMLRKGARHEIFHDNLERLVRHIRRSPQPLRLHFITVALKENASEIPDLIRYCRDELGVEIHEVRYPYYMPHFGGWGHEHVLDAAAWSALEQRLQELGPRTRILVSGPLPGMIEQFENHRPAPDYVAPESAFGGPDDLRDQEPPSPEQVADTLADESLQLRLRWDGLMDVVVGSLRLNINRLERPAEYFEQVRLAVRERAGAAR